jgi:hypothetical protein
MELKLHSHSPPFVVVAPYEMRPTIVESGRKKKSSRDISDRLRDMARRSTTIAMRSGYNDVLL